MRVATRPYGGCARCANKACATHTNLCRSCATSVHSLTPVAHRLPGCMRPPSGLNDILAHASQFAMWLTNLLRLSAPHPDVATAVRMMVRALPDIYTNERLEKRAAVTCVRIAYKWIYDGFDRRSKIMRCLDRYAVPPPDTHHGSWLKHEAKLLADLGWSVWRFFDPAAVASASYVRGASLPAIAQCGKPHGGGWLSAMESARHQHNNDRVVNQQHRLPTDPHPSGPLLAAHDRLLARPANQHATVIQEPAPCVMTGETIKEQEEQEEEEEEGRDRTSSQPTTGDRCATIAHGTIPERITVVRAGASQTLIRKPSHSPTALGRMAKSHQKMALRYRTWAGYRMALRRQKRSLAFANRH